MQVRDMMHWMQVEAYLRDDDRCVLPLGSVEPGASHASWMENVPWTHLAGVVMPEGMKGAPDPSLLRVASPAEVRALVGDGNDGGSYQRADDDMLRIWAIAVAETRAALEGGWGA